MTWTGRPTETMSVSCGRPFSFFFDLIGPYWKANDNRPWGVEGVSRPYDGAVYPQAAGAPVCEGHALAVWDHDGAAGISGGEDFCGH